jgi:hypothetical protein
MKHLVIGFALAATTVPVVAQNNAATVVATEVVLDPAKLAVSRKIADRLIPAGTLKRVMGTTMDSVMGNMLDSVMDMPVKDLARMTGMEEDKLSELNQGSLKEVMAILDPSFKERTRSGMNAMMSEMGNLMATMEPDMRDGMAEAYANQFSAKELADLDQFFNTPSGIAFAAKSMTIQTDPAFMTRMKTLVPKIMEAMPAMVKKAESATSALPKARTVDQLSDDEKKKLAGLLGVKVSELSKAD